MTGNDAREALISGEPVELNGIVYEHITQIIYEPYQGGISVGAELIDKTGRSTTRAPIRYINRIGKAAEPLTAQTAQVPIDSITIRSYAGEFRIEFSFDHGCLVTEHGAEAVPSHDAPYSKEDSVMENVNAALNRMRDAVMYAVRDWNEAHGFDRYTGEPVTSVCETKR